MKVKKRNNPFIFWLCMLKFGIEIYWIKDTFLTKILWMVQKHIFQVKKMRKIIKEKQWSKPSFMLFEAWTSFKSKPLCCCLVELFLQTSVQWMKQAFSNFVMIWFNKKLAIRTLDFLNLEFHSKKLLVRVNQQLDVSWRMDGHMWPNIH